jgi:methyl-accepting chemotaxis protein
MCAVVENIETVTRLDQNMQALKVDGEHGLQSLKHVSTSNGVVLEKVEAMAGSVEGTSAAIEVVSNGIAETSKNLQEISAFVMQTSSSMTEMDASLRNVQANADQTAKLSQMVVADAEHAVATVNETTAGIDRIRDVSKDGSRVIEELGGQIGEIGKIVSFITDVAGRTNLLSLNAAIVAAQAGENGRSFAVVADEIKELANQTRSSSLEIGKLVDRIQKYTEQAIASMGTSIRQVEEGVRQAEETRAALGKILESASSSMRMTDAIASTTVEQAKSSQLITTSVHRIVKVIEELSGSSSEQASHASQIVAATAQMREATRLARQSATEETRVVEGLATSIGKMVDRINEARGGQASQTQGWTEVRRTVETIRQISADQQPTIKDLESAVGTLARQVHSLQDETARFRV